MLEHYPCFWPRGFYVFISIWSRPVRVISSDDVFQGNMFYCRGQCLQFSLPLLSDRRFSETQRKQNLFIDDYSFSQSVLQLYSVQITPKVIIFYVEIMSLITPHSQIVSLWSLNHYLINNNKDKMILSLWCHSVSLVVCDSFPASHRKWCHGLSLVARDSFPASHRKWGVDRQPLWPAGQKWCIMVLLVAQVTGEVNVRSLTWSGSPPRSASHSSVRTTNQMQALNWPFFFF